MTINTFSSSILNHSLEISVQVEKTHLKRKKKIKVNEKIKSFCLLLFTAIKLDAISHLTA